MNEKNHEPFFDWQEKGEGIVAQRGPLRVMINEEINGDLILGNESKLRDSLPESPYVARAIWIWGMETGQFFGAGETSEEAVANAKLIAEAVALSLIKPLWDALAHHIATYPGALAKADELKRRRDILTGTAE
jgi:hypothetical protein